jgi:hypothetical protein
MVLEPILCPNCGSGDVVIGLFINRYEFGVDVGVDV